jgi:dienelactone hydrolase
MAVLPECRMAFLDQYQSPWTFSAGGITHPIYSAGLGPEVVVLHEASGMTDACLKLGLILAESFRVHIPLLFDEPGGESGALRSAKNMARLCVSREIDLFAASKTSPIVDWLRALCRRLKELSGEEGVGVIGMCITGGFALALVADDAVLAPVVAQPSLPLIHRSALGLSPADAAAVRARATALGTGCVLGLRYAGDWMAPRQRIDAIRALIGPSLRYVELPGDRHATLTDHRHPTALSETIAFLRERLGTHPPV